jgi:hypothetical protein
LIMNLVELSQILGFGANALRGGLLGFGGEQCSCRTLWHLFAEFGQNLAVICIISMALCNYAYYAF